MSMVGCSISSSLVDTGGNRFCLRDGAIFNLEINEQAAAVGITEDNVLRYWVERGKLNDLIQVYEVKNFVTGELEQHRYFKN